MPFYTANYEGAEIDMMNQALRLRILESEKNEIPLVIGAMNASKLAQTILRDEKDPHVRHFQSMILDAALALTAHTIGEEESMVVSETFIAEAWAVVYRIGGNHRIHNHPGAVWSGVYYVSCSDHGVGGLLELIDPRPAALAAREEEEGAVLIKPAPGLLVGFPSWLQHNVTPLVDYDERICLAFNVGFSDSASTA